MKERPIFFNSPMVRAILDGTKTQTRRPVKFPRNFAQPEFLCGKGDDQNDPANWGYETDEPGVFVTLADGIPSPYGTKEDRLWVRETFATLSNGDYLPVKPSSGCSQDIRYKADDPLRDTSADIRGYGWRPSIHMPRWASRLTLPINNAWVERLNDISESGAMAEGFIQTNTSPVQNFMREWCDIYGSGQVESNPFVWVTAFDNTRGHCHVPTTPQ